MNFSSITPDDLEELRNLQPEGWPDIIPEIGFYLRNSFCYPIKATEDHQITGIGAAIIYDNTAWLAHIIVDPVYRNRRIGYNIVQELLKIVKKSGVKTCQLIATELGRPVYVKAGFKPVTEYIFMNRDKPFHEFACSEKIIDYQMKYRQPLLEMDKDVTAENREPLLSTYIGGAKIYVSDDELLGYYIPALKEGPVIAMTPEAGLELMKVRNRISERVVFPSDNLNAIDFLMQNGFTRSATKGTRMILGNEINWQPGKIYSRIGGNFG